MRLDISHCDDDLESAVVGLVDFGGDAGADQYAVGVGADPLAGASGRLNKSILDLCFSLFPRGPDAGGFAETLILFLPRAVILARHILTDKAAGHSHKGGCGVPGLPLEGHGIALGRGFAGRVY